MRETMEDGETPEATLNRGALEEFGAIVLIENYLGSLISSFIRDTMNVQKTTLYFKVRVNFSRLVIAQRRRRKHQYS